MNFNESAAIYVGIRKGSEYGWKRGRTVERLRNARVKELPGMEVKRFRERL